MMWRKTFAIDKANRRYIRRVNPNNPEIISWPDGATRTPAHLAHMAGMMQQLGYLILIVKPAPTGVTQLTVAQAAKALGITANSIYHCIKNGKIAAITTPTRKTNKNYRIPLAEIEKYLKAEVK